ncbi:MAG: hypothetical protein GY732_15545, partial [Gammaproteobacteria bacterium]|nr:hypothetical protein [Gammaproteobacteria bacterium]
DVVINGHLRKTDSIENIQGDGTTIVAGDASSQTIDLTNTTLTGVDHIDGGAGHDTIIGSAADDEIHGGAGSDRLYGGEGDDIAVFTNNSTSYSLRKNSNGSITVEDKTGSDGTDTVSDVETLRFADKDISVQEFMADPLTAGFNFNSDDGSYTYNTGGEVKDEAKMMGDAHIENGVLTLDGDGDYLKVTSSSDINLDDVSQRTASFWMKTDQEEGRMLVYEEGGQQAGLNIYLDNGKLYVGAYTAQDDQFDGGFIQANDENGNPLDVADGKWHHVAVTFDGDEELNDNGLTGYLDGKQFGVAEAASLGVHPDPTGIGGVNGTTLLHTGEVISEGMYFNGQLDDAKIYNEALDESAIRELYESPPEGIVVTTGEPGTQEQHLDPIEIEVPSIDLATDIVDDSSVSTDAFDSTAEEQKGSTEKEDSPSHIEENSNNADFIVVGENLNDELPSNGFAPQTTQDQVESTTAVETSPIESSNEPLIEIDPAISEATEPPSGPLDDSIGEKISVSPPDPFDSIGATPSIEIDPTPPASSDATTTTNDTSPFIVTDNGTNGTSEQPEGASSFIVTDNNGDMGDMSAMDGLDNTPTTPKEEQEEIGLAGEESVPPESVTEPAPVITEDIS